jgi:NAD(P)-dependent dehydrogenase (short-subunit alcohol dehydrogenase family)
MQLKPIDQQVVSVVGVSSGIGRETALQFARKGAKLVVSARSQEKLASLADEIKSFGGEVFSILIDDVTIFEQVKAIADQTVEVYGRLDTWVHVPATAVFATFENTTPQEFKRVVDVTLMGQVYGAMAALPHLKREGRGALIHISSMEGKRSLPYQSAYAAGKHGVEGFLEALRLELQHEKVPISVTSIKPGVIDTPFWDNGRTKLGVKPSAIPPYYKASLVAEAVLYTAENPTRDFLVGDAARVLDFLQRLSPELMDTLLLLTGFRLQHSDVRKSEDAPDNLYEPVPYHNTIDGSLSDRLVIPSVTDWIEKNPTVKWGATLAGVGALAMLANQVFNSDGSL